MTTLRKHQTREDRPGELSSTKPVRVSIKFDVPALRSIDGEQVAMAQGMQEWFDSFNKTHNVDENLDDSE